MPEKKSKFTTDDGMLPKSEYSSEYSLFPKNYEDLDYTDGIAAYFDDVMDFIF